MILFLGIIVYADFTIGVSNNQHNEIDKITSQKLRSKRDFQGDKTQNIDYVVVETHDKQFSFNLVFFSRTHFSL